MTTISSPHRSLSSIALSLPTLPLNVPTVDRSRHALPQGADASVSQQVRELPYEDHGAALTLARTRLQHFNRHYVEHQRRAGLNQWFHYAFARFAERVHENTKLRPDAMYASEGDDGFTQFCDELAVAYKHCLIDADSVRAAAAPLASYLYLALFFHVQGMLQRYTHNIKQPPNAWREAHHLYATAEQLGLHRQPSLLKLPMAMPTLHDQYVQLLLVAGANPYSLGLADTLWVIRFTGKAAQATSMIHPDNHDAMSSALGVRLDSDEGPLRLRYKPSGSHPQARLLATATICDQLEGQRLLWHPDSARLQAVAEHLPSGSRERVEALFAHLEECWRCQKHRTVSRQSQRAECEIIWSLPAIYRWLCNGRTAVARHFAEQVSQRFPALLVEESVSGFRFQVPVEYKGYLHPGELLLLSGTECTEEKPVSIGIVRWIKETGDGFLALGAARVDVHIRAAALQLNDPADQEDNERVALLLSKQVQSPQHKFLLCAPDTPCLPGEIDLKLPHLKRYTRARMGNVLMSTPYFKVVDTYLMTALS